MALANGRPLDPYRMRVYPPGTMIADRYEIMGPLGRGGMGDVYRAVHLGLGKHVALKVLGTNAVHDLGARFEREAQAVARLDHPNCVAVLDYGLTADRRQYLVMELLDGITLGALLRSEGMLAPARVCEVARGLLAALAHAHDRGVLHRDLKPDNVMVVLRGVPRIVLIDFGLAALEDANPLTGAGICIGSPAYLAPERLMGTAHSVRADLYAVGVILYELLAGAPPFVGDSPTAVMAQVVHRGPRSLRTVRRDVPPALRAVIRRALAYDPSQRYRDAGEMLAAVAEAERALAPVPWWRRVRRWLRGASR